jgi:hypothetical protein
MANQISPNGPEMAQIMGMVQGMMGNAGGNSGGNKGFISGSNQAGINVTNQATDAGVARADAAADQAARWNAVSDKGSAIQFEGKANSYAWMLLNKAVDNAIKALG